MSVNQSLTTVRRPSDKIDENNMRFERSATEKFLKEYYFSFRKGRLLVTKIWVSVWRSSDKIRENYTCRPFKGFINMACQAYPAVLPRRSWQPFLQQEWLHLGMAVQEMSESWLDSVGDGT